MRSQDPKPRDGHGQFTGRGDSPQKLRLLIADDEPYITLALSGVVSEGFETLAANSFEAAEACFAHGAIDVKATGFELLEWVRGGTF